MFSKLISMIFGGSTAKTNEEAQRFNSLSPAPHQPKAEESLTPIEVPPPFQTEEFRNRFNAEKLALENKVAELQTEITQLEGAKTSLPETTTAATELERRRLESLLKLRREELSGVNWKLRDLASNMLREEKQYLLDQHLALPTVLTSEWKQDGESDYYNPRMVACWIAQRRIVKKDGRHFLIEVRKKSASSYDWAAPYGQERVAWVTDSVSQMNEGELEAVVRDQQTSN